MVAGPEPRYVHWKSLACCYSRTEKKNTDQTSQADKKTVRGSRRFGSRIWIKASTLRDSGLPKFEGSKIARLASLPRTRAFQIVAIHPIRFPPALIIPEKKIGAACPSPTAELHFELADVEGKIARNHHS